MPTVGDHTAFNCFLKPN